MTARLRLERSINRVPCGRLRGGDFKLTVARGEVALSSAKLGEGMSTKRWNAGV